MKQLFLAASIESTGPVVAEDITNDTGKKPGELRLAFIDTGAEVDTGDLQWVEDDRQGLRRAGFSLNEYTITDKSIDDLERDLGGMDIIHVNGGNSFYLLLQARKSGFDKWIIDAVSKGKIYIGSSAGSMVASPNIGIAKNIEDNDYKDELKKFDGIGLAEVMAFPHWGSEAFKDLYLNRRLDVAYKKENKIVLLNDYQYLKIIDDKIEFKDMRDK